MTSQPSPLDTARLRKVGNQQGSNPAGIYEDESGQRYYIKTLESVAHARNEYIAAMLYRLAGAPTFTYRPTVAPDQIATEWVPLEKKYTAHLSQDERHQAQQWLGVHAWTANWDAAGFGGDNQGTLDGKVLTLDVGGALQFRAQGDPKGSAFGTRVEELETLRSDTHNPHAVALFGDMSPEAIADAIRRVVSIPDELVRKTVLENGGSASLADKLIARKADMAERLGSYRAPR